MDGDSVKGEITMTRSQSEKFISILINTKKRSEIFLEKPYMSCLDAFQLGFIMACDITDRSFKKENRKLTFLLKHYAKNTPSIARGIIL